MHRLILGSTALFAAIVATPASAQQVYGLVGSDRIVTFNAATPGTITSSAPITGLAGGEVLTGIDFRPADRKLYSLGTSGTLYSLSLSGGSYFATPIGGPLGAPVSGSNFGIDFNPTVDRLRFVTDADQNLRINPVTGVAITDGMINPASFNLIGAAYTNSFTGATATRLFAIDSLSASLARSTNANMGSYISIGSLGLGPIGTDARVGFDIAAVGGNIAYLALNDSLYTVNLDTGGATLIGGIGGGGNIRGISAAIPEPATWAMMIGGFGLVGAALRRRPKAALARA